MGVGGLFAQHAACSAASTRPPHARALGMPAARLPTWPGCAWQAPARHRSGAPEARFARCWLSPRRRFHVMPAVAGAETSRKCASSQLLMDLRREPSPPINPSAGPARPSGGFVQACCVSVEVIRARLGAARVPLWVSFIPVMKHKPTLPRARTRAALLDSLAPAPSHPPHEIGGCDPESAQRCRWRAHHTHPSCLHHSCTHCPVWPGRGARSGMAARLN